MSYYVYKKKYWVETSRGDLLPLAYVADSSLRNDRGGFVASWGVCNFHKGILLSKDTFRQEAEKAYQEEMEHITDWKMKSGEPYESAGPEDYGYYGTRYPGGRKMRHMKAFFSVHKTIPMEQFLTEHPYLTLHISAYNTASYKTIAPASVHITDEDAVYKAQSVYEEMQKQNPECAMCIGVFGLDNE